MTDTFRLLALSAGLSTPSSTRMLADQLTREASAALGADGEVGVLFRDQRVGRWEVDRMAARRTTESRGFVLEPRCLALVSRWGMEEHAGRGGGGCWAAWTYHVGSQVQRVAKTPPSRPSQ